MFYLILTIILLIFIIILLLVLLFKTIFKNFNNKNENLNNKNQEIDSLRKKVKKYKRIFPILNNEEHEYYQEVDSLKNKGILGEVSVKRDLERITEKHNLILFNDLYLALNETVVQIDHILIAKNCVFIIETKNWFINTFGSINDTNWFQIHGNIKKSVNSPIKQNYGHLKLVMSILKNNKNININDLHFYNLVVFVQNNLQLTNDFYSKNNIYFKALNFSQLDTYIDNILKENIFSYQDYVPDISVAILKCNEFKNIALHSKIVKY